MTTPAPARNTIFGPGRDADRRHLRDILRNETVGGLVLLLATIAALLAATFAPDAYQHLMHISIGQLQVHQWAADGLLTIFFFVAGLELKREFVEGSLSRPKDALLPIIAAIGGMVVPACVYLLTSGLGGGSLGGWAIPMATDIAFALALLALVGSNLPSGLRAFLLTLAIVDDLGAIIVIAVFFNHGLHFGPLAGSLACVALFWLGQRLRLDKHRGAFVAFATLGVLAWWLMLSSGVHATIAGVALGLVTRTNEFEEHDPVDRWQHAIEPWSAGIVVPVFAFCSAGIAVNVGMLKGIVEHPEALGVALGLVVGKAVGVFTAARVTAVVTSAELADGVLWRDVAALAVLTGVGFTVSLLMSDLAFPNDPALASSAKAAVLVASLVAGIVGAALLRRRNKSHIAPSA